MAAPNLLRTIQSLGITTAFLMSGMNLASSTLFIPSISSPVLSTRFSTAVFAHIYHAGAPILVPLALSCSLFNFVNGYIVSEARPTYVSAALCAIGTMAWTGLFMLKGIGRLLEIGEMERAKQEERQGEVVELLEAWKRQNYVRAGLGFVAGVLGVYAALW